MEPAFGLRLLRHTRLGVNGVLVVGPQSPLIPLLSSFSSSNSSRQSSLVFSSGASRRRSTGGKATPPELNRLRRIRLNGMAQIVAGGVARRRGSWG